MKNLLTKITLVACLASPVLAAAAGGSSPANAHDSDRDEYSFNLATTSTVSIDYSWSDLLVNARGSTTTTEFNATSLLWSLTGPTTRNGSLTDTDITEKTSGTGRLTFADLLAGKYTLVLSGNWKYINPSTVGGAKNMTNPDVALLGSSYNAVPAVPEPETYAMLVAGLGLMGFIARRRSRQAV